MSYTPLAHVSTGELATAALHNTLLDNVDYLFNLPAGSLTKIGSAQGSTTSGVAVNLATFAISGLTVKDALFVLATVSNTGNTGTVPVLYNVTDSVQICELSTVSATANMARMFISTNGTSTTQVCASGTRDTTNDNTVSTFATAFTGSWTLAYRLNGGITSGTHYYNVRVWKCAG